MNGARVTSLHSVMVIGTGLIGTSIALSLRDSGVRVFLRDSDPDAAAVAVGRGAGTIAHPDEPVDIAVLAVPPSRIADVLVTSQRERVARVYTDVGSVKAAPLARALESGCDPQTYIGGHPMAGSERSGPAAASASLFRGKRWVLTPSSDTRSDSLTTARELVRAVGAIPFLTDAENHDRMVARTSHVPHLVSSLLAARLAGADERTLSLCGAGIRDTTRTAAGDPALWADILQCNSVQVADVLDELAADLTAVRVSLRSGSGFLTTLLQHGSLGREMMGRAAGEQSAPAPVNC